MYEMPVMKDIAVYSTAEVAELLMKMNLACYIPAFEANQVDGELLVRLDDDMLKDDLGVSSKLHRLRLLKEVEERLCDGAYEPVIVSRAIGGDEGVCGAPPPPPRPAAFSDGGIGSAHDYEDPDNGGVGGGTAAPKDIADYSTAEAAELLVKLNMVTFVPRFQDAKVDGKTLLQADEAMLEADLGVTHKPHRLRLLSQVRELNTSATAKSTTMVAKQAVHAEVMTVAATTRAKMVAANPAAAHAANEVVDAEGRTKLCAAARDGKVGDVVALLAAGADPNLGKANTGTTPLYFAAQGGSLDACMALLAFGADPSTPNAADGTTPVWKAAQKGEYNILAVLLDAGADPLTPRTTDGSSPIYVAAQKGHLDCIAALLSAGASAATTTIKGMTALRISQQKGHTACAALLERHLAAGESKANSMLVLLQQVQSALYLHRNTKPTNQATAFRRMWG
jgi:hypothetical protein